VPQRDMKFVGMVGTNRPRDENSKQGMNEAFYHCCVWVVGRGGWQCVGSDML
jgi:hypothetical protein